MKNSIVRLGTAIVGSALLLVAVATPVLADHEGYAHKDGAADIQLAQSGTSEFSGSGKSAGDIRVRFRGVAFLTNTSGTTNTLGGNARTSDDFIPELDISYFITDNVAVELILGYTKHSVEVKDSTAGDLDLGSVKLIPPVLTLQYHFQPKKRFSPYIGAGVHYGIWFDKDFGRSVNDVSYSNEFGWAAQVGMDYALTDKYSFNIDVKKVFTHTDIGVNNGTITANDTDLDPLVVGIGVGYQF